MRIILYILIILLYALIFCLLIYQYYKKYRIEYYKNTISNVKCSVFILNYNRPNNVYKQIDYLLNNEYVNEIIDEIIVSNGHPDYKVKYPNVDKVRIIDDIDNNSKIYTNRRWLGIVNNCNNEYVLQLDDDVLPSPDLIIKLVYNVHKDPYNIYGPIKRSCTPSGYKTKIKFFDSYNTILTPISMTSKTLVQDYIDTYFHIYNDWVREHKGNCEDLSINMFLLHKHIKPVFVNDKYSWLDTSNGYHSKSDHYIVRNNFCKIYSQPYDLNDYSKIKQNWIHNIFDSVYIITIPKRVYHVNYISNTMKIKPIIFNAVDKNTLDKKHLVDNNIITSKYYSTNNKGRIACHLSHINVMIDFLKNPNKKHCMIFEDDMKLPNTLTNIVHIMENSMKNIPNTWDIIYFGRCWDDCRKAVYYNKYLMKSNPLCRHAYAVSRKGATKIVEHTLPMVHNGDDMYRILIDSHVLDSYSTKIPLFFQNRENELSTLGNNGVLKVCKPIPWFFGSFFGSSDDKTQLLSIKQIQNNLIQLKNGTYVKGVSYDEMNAIYIINRKFKCICSQNSIHFPKIVDVIKDKNTYWVHLINCGKSLDKNQLPIKKIPNHMEQIECILNNLIKCNIGHIDILKKNMCIEENTHTISLIDFERCIFLDSNKLFNNPKCLKYGKTNLHKIDKGGYRNFFYKKIHNEVLK